MSSDDCPERPQSRSDLDFTPQSMVQWFRPTELIRTGTEALLSSLFGAYADWREVQALHAQHKGSRSASDSTSPCTFRTCPLIEARGDAEWYDFSEAESLWFDYTADLADGFDSTYTVARLLAERTLTVNDYETERGEFLIMGGDQVYPAASRSAYNDRLRGPYRAALPCVTDEPAPRLFAIPGNHDWYDGLTSFLRLFTQNRWIGGWKTHQRRSYFAIKLPHDWWLWGIDIQLNSDIDEPQLNYFRSLAANESVMPTGSRVLLCSADPSWVYAETKGPEAYHNLGYVQDKILSENGHELAVGLAGDLHTYARYTSTETDQQRFVAGGGGAYLHPTHDLPAALHVETPGGEQADFSLSQARHEGAGKSVYPDRATSRRLTWGALLLPFKNPSFGIGAALLYLLLTWLTESSTIIPLVNGSLSDGPPSSLLVRMSQTSDVLGLLTAVADVAKHAPGTVTLTLLLWVGLIGFADLKNIVGRLVVGSLHTCAHLALAILLMWGFGYVNLNLLSLSPRGFPHAVLFVLELFGIGGLLGGILTGLYLIVTNRLLGAMGLHGVHANEVFSCQHIPDYKHFLRLHVDDDGDLTIYPIGIPTVETNWTLRPDDPRQAPWFEGEEDLTDRVELIEPPVPA